MLKQKGKAALFLVSCLFFASCPSLSHDPAKSSTRLELAKDFLLKHELETAEAEANRALAYNPQNEEAFWVRGLIAYVQAIDAQRMLETDGCLTGVDAEAVQKDLDLALAKADGDFKRATELARDYSEAWANRGIIANLREDPEAAVAHFKISFENPVRLLRPALTRAHLGWAYFKLGDMAKAAKEFMTALQFQPGMCLASYRLGRVYFVREEWDKAAEQFQRVVEADANPNIKERCNDQNARYYLMKVYLQQGLLDEAQKAKASCVSLYPKSCVAAQCQAQQLDVK